MEANKTTYTYDTIAFVTIPVVFTTKYDHLPTEDKVEWDVEQTILDCRTVKKVLATGYVLDYTVEDYYIQPDLMCVGDENFNTWVEARFAKE